MTKDIREVVMLVHYQDNTVGVIRGLKCASLQGGATYTDPAGNVVNPWETPVLGRKDITVMYQFSFFDVEVQPDGSAYRYRAVRPPEEKEKK